MSDEHRFCDNCGSPISPDSRFCDNCGKPIGQAPPPPQPSAPPPQPQYTGGYNPPPQKSKSRANIIVPIVIFAIIIASLVYVFVISGDDDDSDGISDRSYTVSNNDGRVSVTDQDGNDITSLLDSDQDCNGEADFSVSNLKIRQNSKEMFDASIDVRNTGDCPGVYEPVSTIDGERHGDEAGVRLNPGESTTHPLIMVETYLDLLYLDDMYEDRSHSDHRVCVDGTCQTVYGSDYN